MQNNQLNRKNHSRRGMSIAPVMMFALGFTTVGISVISMSNTYNRGAKKVADKVQSNSLAESAANVLFDNIRVQMRADQTFPFNLNEVALTVPKEGGGDETIGNYSARVTANREVQTDVEIYGTKYRKFTYYFTIEGRGTAAGGVESVVQCNFKGDIYKYLVPRHTVTATPPPNSFSFPIGAIVSNTDIDIRTDQGLRTSSLDGKNGGHVIANDGISWRAASGSKNSIVNPNLLDIQGYWLVPDGASYSATTGNSGLGNPNGTKNYRSPAAPAEGDFPGAAANTVIKLEDTVGFADETQVNNWKNDWYAQATTGAYNNYASNVNSGSIAPRPGDGKIGIQAPAKLEGDLDVADGEKVELWPASTDPRKNVVYIKGDVKNRGQIVNHGVTLVFEGKYEDDSDAEYKIEPDAATFKDRDLAVMRSAFLSLNKSKNAIKFHTNSSATTGLIYALNGGIEVDGSNAEFTGMLLAGGSGSNGGIQIRPGGGSSFVVNYDPYAATGGTLALDAGSVIDTEMVTNGTQSPFSPTKMVDWIQKK
jgi:hypothetical protein